MDQNLFSDIQNDDGNSKQYTCEKSSSVADDLKVHNKSFIEEFEDRLAVGRIIISPEDAYLLYCEYGRVKGFSVRKGKQEYFHDNSRELYMKEFACSCKGIKDEKCSVKGKQPISSRVDYRSGCPTRIAWEGKCRFSKERCI